jgi:hypothetical protein
VPVVRAAFWECGSAHSESLQGFLTDLSVCQVFMVIFDILASHYRMSMWHQKMLTIHADRLAAIQVCCSLTGLGRTCKRSRGSSVYPRKKAPPRGSVAYWQALLCL